MNRVVAILLLVVLAVVAGGCGKQESTVVTVDNVKDKRIGVLLGSVHDTYVTKTYPKATVLQYKSPTDIVLAVKSGKVNAAVYSRETLREILREDAELGLVQATLFAVPIGIGFNKSNDALRTSFNAFLREIKQNGVYDDMVDRWITRGGTQMPDVANTRTNGVLVAGNVSDKGLPFTVLKNGKLIGFDIELADRFGAHVGKEVKYSDLEFGSLVAAAASQKIDMIVSTLMITEERKKQINFSDPYYELGSSMFALKKNLAPSASGTAAEAGEGGGMRLQALDGKRIVVLPGSAGDAAARKHFPGASFQVMNESADAALAVKTSKAEAFVYDKSVLLNIAERNPELIILEERVDKLDVAAAVNKENTALLGQVNAVMQALQADGTLQRLRAKWVDAKYTTPPSLPPVAKAGTGGVLRMGTCGTIEPFSFQSNGTLTGLDIELGRVLGERLGKTVEVVDMTFDALIPALQGGKIDLALSNFNVTEERKTRISFSLPYVSNDISALVRRGAAESGAQTAVPQSFLSGVASSFRSNILQERRYLLILEGLKTTAIISVLATLFGTLLGGLVCFMRMSPRRILNVPAKGYIATLRGTPVLVLLMLIFYVVFASIDINPVLVAVIAFGMNFAAYAAEIFRSGVEGVDKGQTEAGISLGFTRASTFFHIVLPQMVRNILPIYKGEFISLVTMTSIVGYIGVQDLTKASDIIRSRTFDAFFPLIMVAVLYFGISWVLMQALGYLERRTDPRLRRKQLATA